MRHGIILYRACNLCLQSHTYHLNNSQSCARIRRVVIPFTFLKAKSKSAIPHPTPPPDSSLLVLLSSSSATSSGWQLHRWSGGSWPICGDEIETVAFDGVITNTLFNYSLLAPWFLEIGIKRQNWDVGKTGGHCSRSRPLICPSADSNSDNEFLWSCVKIYIKQ